MHVQINGDVHVHYHCSHGRRSLSTRVGGALLRLAGAAIVTGVGLVGWCVFRVAHGLLLFEEAAGGAPDRLAFTSITRSLLGPGERVNEMQRLESDYVD